MRRILRSAAFAVAAAGVLVTMSLPAAGAQAAAQPRPATGPLAGLLPGVATAAPTYGVLFGVYCASKTDCWAVGQRSRNDQLANLMMHWNGKTWSQSTVPNPSQADDELFNVRCLSSKDCWAVGQYLKDITWLAEALHWNGKKWSSTKVPAYGGTSTNDVTELFDSTCTAANNCWAVGDFGISEAPPQKLLNLVVHWNGKKWSKVSAPNPGGTKLTDQNFLDGVRCVAASNCNAAGGYGSVLTAKNIILNEILHWNGKRWSWIHAPNPAGTGKNKNNQVEALACGAANSCWGAGLDGTDEPANKFANEMLHWNGKTWANFKIPDPGGTKAGDTNYLYGATCDGSANCWAVGQYRNSHNVTVNEALHWNGKHWTLVSTPNPASSSLSMNELYQVRCTSSTNCWAVGGSQPYLGIETRAILHWNGKHWSIWT